MRVNYSIITVSDMHRSVAFYRDVFGLTVRFESLYWTEFATEGATLALHIADDDTVPAQHGNAEVAGTCRAGLSVPDLDAFHQKMIANDVPCLQEPTLVFGVRIAKYCDPDGLSISVSEDRTSTGS